MIKLLIYITSIFRTPGTDGKKIWNIIHTVSEKGETKVEFFTDEQMTQFEIDPKKDVSTLGPKPNLIPFRVNYDGRGRLVGIYTTE